MNRKSEQDDFAVWLHLQKLRQLFWHPKSLTGIIRSEGARARDDKPTHSAIVDVVVGLLYAHNLLMQRNEHREPSVSHITASSQPGSALYGHNLREVFTRLRQSV